MHSREWALLLLPYAVNEEVLRNAGLYVDSGVWHVNLSF
jgi:hypothetical protein